MVRYWGGWTASSGTGQQFRLGIDYTVSGTTITVQNYVFEAAFSIAQNNITLNRQQGLTGTRTFNANTSGGVLNIGHGGSVTGSRGSGVRFQAKTEGVYNGLNPSFDTTINIPAAAPAKPAAPTISAITTTTATATAVAPSSNGASITGYDWQVEGGPAQSSTVGRVAGITGLTANTSYRVRVRAKNSAGTGSWSPYSASFKTGALAPSKPAAPTISNVGTTTATATLGTAPANNGAAITGYSWQVEGGPAQSGTTGRTKALTGLSPNTQYRVRVQAKNSAGSSSWSNWSGYFTTAPLAPNAATNLTASFVSDTRIDLAWTDNADNAHPVDRYDVLRTPRVAGAWGTESKVGEAHGTGYSDTSVTGGQEYRYRLRAQNTGGSTDSGYSASVRTTPSAPIIGTVTKDPGGALRVKYTPTVPYTTSVNHVLQDNPNGTGWVTVATVTGSGDLVHAAPNPAVTHRYRVVTRSTAPNVLDSAPSAPTQVVQLQAPPNAPTLIAPAVGVYEAGSALTATWAHNPVDGSAQSKAEVDYRAGTSGSWTTITVNSATQHTPLTLPSVEGVVQLRVRTWGSDPNPSPYSAVRTLNVGYRPLVNIIAPAAGTFPSSKVDPLSWGYSQQAGSGQVAWQARLTQGGAVLEDRTVATGTHSGALTTVLDDATTYRVYLRVQAANGLWSHETGDVWEWVEFTTDFPPPECYDVNADWDPVTGSVALSFTVAGAQAPNAVPAEWLTIVRRDQTGTNVIADHVDPDQSITDPIPGLSEVDYWAISNTSLPSTSTCTRTTVPLYDGSVNRCPYPAEGIPVLSAYLNGGDGYALVGRAEAGLHIDEPQVGLTERVLHRYSQRAYPVEISGVGRVQELTVTFATTSTGVLRDGTVISTVDVWRTLANTPAPFWWRDHSGHKFQATIRPLAVTRNEVGGGYTVVLQVTRISEEPFILGGES